MKVFFDLLQRTYIIIYEIKYFISLFEKELKFDYRYMTHEKYRKMYFTISLVVVAVIFGNGLVLSAGRDFPSGNT